MSQYAIQVEHLSKSYRIRQGERAGYTALRDVLSERTGKFFGRLAKGKNPFQGEETHEEFWALNDVSFNVEHGEVLGIIGKNGAGKSTLLKLLSRITEPDKGKITLNGRVASLLEVGTGFHPELTGRENIYLSGAILGMRREEIKKRFDEIVDFAGVEKFLDTPVKRYSSGMYVRLGFAVAAHLETEILLVDEVLAVGDAEFQRRCVQKLKEIIKQNKAVIVVSHNLDIVISICKSSILLNQGKLEVYDKSENVIKQYSTFQSSKLKHLIEFTGPLSSRVKFVQATINDSYPNLEEVYLTPFKTVVIKIELEVEQINLLRVTLSIFCNGVRIFTCHDSQGECTKKGRITSVFEIPNRTLRPGLYSIAIGGLEKDGLGDWFWKKDICFFSIIEEWDDNFEAINDGLINVKVNSKRIPNDS